jgi:hypothetical protein
MQQFTTEAAEKIISLLCYSRTEDTYYYGKHGKCPGIEGAFRLSISLNRRSPRVVLSNCYQSAKYRTTTVETAIKLGLLAPSWEDLATKLFFNDQDILYMCSMSHEEPACLRLIDVERIKAYRDQHNNIAEAGKLTFMPRSAPANRQASEQGEAVDRTKARKTGSAGRAAA